MKPLPDNSLHSGRVVSVVESLPERRDFLRLRNGSRYSCRGFTLQCGPGPEQSSIRVGYTVTTKVGSAVVRNRIKRRLRAAVANVFPEAANPGRDYVLIARRNSLTLGFATIVQDLKHALDHVHKNKSKSGRG